MLSFFHNLQGRKDAHEHSTCHSAKGSIFRWESLRTYMSTPRTWNIMDISSFAGSDVNRSASSRWADALPAWIRDKSLSDNALPSIKLKLRSLATWKAWKSNVGRLLRTTKRKFAGRCIRFACKYIWTHGWHEIQTVMWKNCKFVSHVFSIIPMYQANSEWATKSTTFQSHNRRSIAHARNCIFHWNLD